MRATLLYLAVTALYAQQPSEVLERAQAQLSGAAAATPKYTCTQTVDRSYFREARQVVRGCDSIVANHRMNRSKLALTATDRLRFYVEVADGGYEIYAWPGAGRIATEQVEVMAGGGPLGSGPFGPFLLDVFTNPGVQFEYLGEKEALYQYRYRVPVAISHYRIQANETWRTTGYDGTFLLEPGSAELKQLTVRTLELPADTWACEATSIMDFESIKIGAGEYLIPQQTKLQVINRDGGFTENSTSYSECQEFRGESVVHFDQPAPTSSVGSKLHNDLPPQRLPPGLPVVLALDTEIDTDRAAAGDVLTAHLQKALFDPTTKRMLAPAGSLVKGRVTQLEHHVDGEKYFLVGVSLESLETPGATIPLSIILDSAQQKLDSRTYKEVRGGIPPVVTTESRSGFHSGGTLIFQTKDPSYVVPRGVLMNWITLGE